MGYQRRVHGDRSPRRTKMRLISVVICGLFYSALANDDKQPKNIGIFNVVRFPNAACVGSNGNMGTCYTAEECEDNSVLPVDHVLMVMVSVVFSQSIAVEHPVRISPCL